MNPVQYFPIDEYDWYSYTSRICSYLNLPGCYCALGKAKLPKELYEEYTKEFDRGEYFATENMKKAIASMLSKKIEYVETCKKKNSEWYSKLGIVISTIAFLAGLTFNLKTAIQRLRKCNLLIHKGLKNCRLLSSMSGNFSSHSESISCVCGAFESPFLG